MASTEIQPTKSTNNRIKNYNNKQKFKKISNNAWLIATKLLNNSKKKQLLNRTKVTTAFHNINC
jgi:hypothetical protein